MKGTAATVRGVAVVQELRISEEGLQVAVLDDPAIGLVAEGCRHLRSLDLVQVRRPTPSPLRGALLLLLPLLCSTLHP
jgi:hypothetical protein